MLKMKQQKMLMGGKRIIEIPVIKLNSKTKQKQTNNNNSKNNKNLKMLNLGTR